MTIERIKLTSLWKSSLAKNINDSYTQQREELRSSLLKFRDNTSRLVTQISSALPGLTLHDSSHLDALWETASLICGENYPLTPLEAFVLGGAILLHDSALCFEAYDNGRDGVRNTVVWKDYFASIQDTNKGNDISALESQADFVALRNLHAVQAEMLCERNWTHPDNGQSLYLIENATLRIHLGKLIGQIAASHHWDIEDVVSKLPNQMNALSGYPREWRINPIKLACILRCADAAHIDNERAPDFLHALIKRKGISYQHWQAQNKLASVDIDQSDATQSTLLFTSTSKFLEKDSEAWWVAYDATCMIDREIRASNALLESLKIPQFQVKRVRAIESPELMSKHIQTEDWHPCAAEIHVGNIEGLINTLGGEKLYGTDCDKLEIVLRETIQNARDAIQARRIFDDKNGYKGKITVRLRKIDKQRWLTIEDDGVGMSKRVLTGSLLDFGTSFWTSSLVQSEFPGLRASKFKPVGKFGIGFYSVFMCAEEVRVTSRRWTEGYNDVWQIHFKNGLSLRPILKNATPNDFSSSTTSTQVLIRLKENILVKDDFVTIKNNNLGASNFDVSIANYISAICAGLDVSVFFSTDDSLGSEIHPEEINDSNKLEWLKNISFSAYQNAQIADYIDNNHSRLKPIIDDGKCCGMAAISTTLYMPGYLNKTTIGGLATSVHYKGRDHFIGYIDCVPQSAARRDGQNHIASPLAIKNWVQEQLSLIKLGELDYESRYALASSLCEFGVDPSEIALILIIMNNTLHIATFDQLADLSLNKPIAILKTPFIGCMELKIETYNQFNINYKANYIVISPLHSGRFITIEMENNIPVENNSILDCLYRAILKKGYTPAIEIVKDSTIKSSFRMLEIIYIKSTKS